MSDIPRRKGTWREPGGEKIKGTVAWAAWADAARPILIVAARDYGSFITYKELSERVQSDTQIFTTQRMDYWIGKVLGAVASESSTLGEPLLSAFCLHADETVGPGYAGAVLDAYGFVPEDADVHAAEERLAAHRHFAAELPPDGGQARLPPGIARKRARAKQSEPRPSRAQCPNCFIELPITGVCDQCS